MFKDETNKQYGRLKVISRAENSSLGITRWNCVCNCGKHVTVLGAGLRNGSTSSCGCYSTDIHTKHMMCFTLEYKSWQGMKDRCTNPRCKDFSRYGGRGITVCDEWVNDFSRFFADMGNREKNQSLDRIDNSKGYSPDNCRWASPLQQSNNTRKTRKITHDGKVLSISEWARIIGITPQALSKRLKISSATTYIFSKKMFPNGKERQPVW